LIVDLQLESQETGKRLEEKIQRIDEKLDELFKMFSSPPAYVPTPQAKESRESLPGYDYNGDSPELKPEKPSDLGKKPVSNSWNLKPAVAVAGALVGVAAYVGSQVFG
jgi:hypothetical protein